MTVEPEPAATLLPPQDHSLEILRSKGSFVEDDDASSAEEKKEATTAEDNNIAVDDTSLRIVGSCSSEEDSNLDNDDGSAAIDNANNKSFDDTTIIDEVTVQKSEPCPRWADVLSTPSNAAVFTPTADINSLKQNMHGWGKMILFYSPTHTSFLV